MRSGATGVRNPGTAHSVRFRAVRRSLLAAVAVSGLLVAHVLTAPIASAHDALIAIAPTDGTEVATSPAAVTLTFNGPVSTQFSEVVVTGPDGAAWQLDASTVSGAIVTQPLAADGPAGTYEVAWRVVSADGHPISGAFSYVVTTGPITSAAPSTASVPPEESSPPAATASPPGQSAADPSPTAATAPDDATNWLPIVLVLVVLMAALGLAAFVVSRRSGSVGRGG